MKNTKNKIDRKDKTNYQKKEKGQIYLKFMIM